MERDNTSQTARCTIGSGIAELRLAQLQASMMELTGRLVRPADLGGTMGLEPWLSLDRFQEAPSLGRKKTIHVVLDCNLEKVEWGMNSIESVEVSSVLAGDLDHTHSSINNGTGRHSLHAHYNHLVDEVGNTP